MKIEDFITEFTNLFDERDHNEFTPETKFKDIEEWSSILALSLIAMADDEYSIELTGKEIQNALTIQDLYEIIEAKLQA